MIENQSILSINFKMRLRIGIFVLVILFWQFGFFNKYNYFTAKIDIWKNSPVIATIGVPVPCGDNCIKLKAKYGINELYVGCLMTGPKLRGINSYNLQVEKFLDKRNGKNWWKKYERELEVLLKNDLSDLE